MARARATSPEGMVGERSQRCSSVRSPSESAMLKLSLRPRISVPLSATAPNHDSGSLFSQFRYPILRSCTKTRVHFRLRGAVLVRSLAKRNISQNRFARLCGLSSGYMSQLISGERFAGPRTRQKILDAFPMMEFEQFFEEVEGRGD